MSNISNSVAIFSSTLLLVIVLVESATPTSKLPNHDAIAFLKAKGVIPASASVGYRNMPVPTTCYPVDWSEHGLADPHIHRELICAPIDGVFPRVDMKDPEKN